MFYVAGCESCHMSPGQNDPLRLGGGMELKTPFGAFYPPNISPDQKDGIGSWAPADFANAIMAGVSPSGQHLDPAFALYVLLPHVDQGRAGPLCLPAHDAAGLGARAAECAEIPVLDPPGGRVVEAPLHAEDRAPARRRSVRPGRLGATWSRGPDIAPNATRPATFSEESSSSRRLTGGPLPDSKGKAPTSRRTASGLVGRRRRHRAVDRLHPVGRRARRPDGPGGAQPLASAGGRPRGDRPLPQDLQGWVAAVVRLQEQAR